MTAAGAPTDDWVAPQPGSTEELITNFLRSRRKERVRCVWALRDTILATASGIGEPAVTMAKLDWWRQELRRLARGAPRHPLTISLEPLLASSPEPAGWLEELVSAAESLVRRETPESFAELRLWCFRREASALTIADAAEEIPQREAAKHAGIAWALSKTITDLTAGRNLNLLPQELISRHGLLGISPGEWRQSPDFDAALRDIADRGQAEIDAIDESSAGVATAMVAAVSRRELEAHRHAPGRRPNPLQLLWRTWRAARRQARASAGSADPESP